MQGAVEKREEADHPPEPDDAVPPRKPAKRCHRQREAQKPQRPDARLVGDVAERIRAEVAGQRGPKQPRRRNRTGQKYGSLQEPAATDHFSGDRPPLALARTTTASRPTSVVLLEVHAGVHARDLSAVTVEHQRFSLEELADAALGRLAPPWMVDVRIHVRVEAVLVGGLIL